MEDHVASFFARYPRFDYEATHGVVSEYDRMVEYFGWRVGGKKMQRALPLFQKALVAQFGCLFGTDENKLENLQHLCEKLEISPIPANVTACKMVRHSNPLLTK